jgi:hypothetical protein
MPDNRMLWIRNLDSIAPSSGHAVEAELASELHIPGLLTYAGDAVQFQAITGRPDPTGLYKYTLRLRFPDSSQAHS